MMRRVRHVLNTFARNSTTWRAASTSTGGSADPAFTILPLLLTESPFQLASIPNTGRGLVATSAIAQGTPIYRAEPIAASPHPTASLCAHCLKPLHAPPQAHSYCSTPCAQAAQSSYALIDEAAGDAFLALQSHCQRHAERFPLVAHRLAALAITGRAGLGRASASFPHDWLSLLCRARISPVPDQWRQAHELVLASLTRGTRRILAKRGGGEEGLLASLPTTYSLDWYASTLGMLHLNAFRIDPIVITSPNAFEESVMDRMAALIRSQENDSKGDDSLSSSPSQAGTALYFVPSFFNHDCDPNVNIQRPMNNATSVFVANRDIAAGEELRISYCDTSPSVHVRRQHLQFAYGFECKCEKCREESDES